MSEPALGGAPKAATGSQKFIGAASAQKIHYHSIEQRRNTGSISNANLRAGANDDPMMLANQGKLPYLSQKDLAKPRAGSQGGAGLNNSLIHIKAPYSATRAHKKNIALINTSSLQEIVDAGNHGDVDLESVSSIQQ